MGAVALRVMRGKPSGVEEIKQGIVMASSVSSYVYAAKVGNKVILFDAGADPDGKPIDALLGWLHAGRGDITDVFFSHGHGDHTAGAAGLRNVHLRLGAGDIALAEKKVPPEAFAGKVFTTVMSFPAVTAGDPLTGAATIDVGDAQAGKDPKDAKKVKAFPIPGHTPGSYAFLYDGVLFVGDAMIFKQGRLDPAIKLFDAHPRREQGRHPAIAEADRKRGDRHHLHRPRRLHAQGPRPQPADRPGRPAVGDSVVERRNRAGRG